MRGSKALNILIDKSNVKELVHVDEENNEKFLQEVLDVVDEVLETMQATNINAKDEVIIELLTLGK